MVAGKFRFYALWLCLICVVVFGLQLVFGGFTEAFVLNENAVSGFEIWRFVSSIFLHGNFSHLAFNLFALALFGSILEKIIGGKKFLWVFFLSGIFANIVSVNFYSSSLGASGAIYGILGALVVIRPLMVVWAFGLPMPMFIAGALWVGAGIFGLFEPSNVGHIAHLSGIAVGFIFGLFLIIRKRKKVGNGDRRSERKEIDLGGRKIRIHEPSMRRWEDSWVVGR